jgi:DNA (cytosine-5)-methyltransferase 1
VPDEPTLLDLFCKAGGAAAGYARVGFRVLGVDHIAQPNYPFEFHRADALDFLLAHGRDFDAIHASPPCQAYSAARTVRGRDDHPDLVGPTRDLLQRVGRPFVIENVPGAPLDPARTVLICGQSLGLRQYRHRLFETSFPCPEPPHLPHATRQTKLGRPPRDDEFLQVVGNFSGTARARRDLECWWMTRDELREAIPPRYTQHVGYYLRRHLDLLPWHQPATGPRDGDDNEIARWEREPRAT